MDILEKIKSASDRIAQETVANRRHLHAHPELSFQEFETAKFVAAQLRKIGIEPQEGVAGTGLVALIEGKNPGKKTVALRADMDALPITELNDVPYKSQNTGVMHACGHDVHTSSLLACARILQEIKDRFEGTVKLIFQPGEEKLPGGASLMIKEGVLQNPKPDKVVGLHVMPGLAAGKVGFREGLYMASADEIFMKVIGKGGHAAVPESFIDPVLITAHILVALQQITSRKASPKIPTVLSFGKVIANGATNVIPDEVNVEGTFRTLDEGWRFEAHRLMKKMAEGMAESMGGRCEFEIKVGYPFLKNEPALTRNLKAWAKEYLGDDQVVDLDLWMASEDFAFYSQESDACFYRLGTRNESRGIVSGVHTPTFDIDESALALSPGLMAWLACKELGNE